jgi:hypothetical protein
LRGGGVDAGFGAEQIPIPLQGNSFGIGQGEARSPRRRRLGGTCFHCEKAAQTNENVFNQSKFFSCFQSREPSSNVHAIISGQRRNLLSSGRLDIGQATGFSPVLSLSYHQW